MFKIGVGPSSSHTLGPWRAAQKFVRMLEDNDLLYRVTNLEVFLYGSLAKTGKGHGTDIAVQLGLSGDDPVSFDVDRINSKIRDIRSMKILLMAGKHEVNFNPEEDIEFLYGETLPYHPNALTFMAQLDFGEPIAETYYSVGGGFVEKGGGLSSQSSVELPFPIDNSEGLLHWCMKTGMSISEIVMENEHAWRPEAETRKGVTQIWEVMKACMYRGIHTEGMLPGGLSVTRRAAALNRKLANGRMYDDYDSWIAMMQQGGSSFRYIIDWVSCFALAVNEENASFGRVVTAPTNGGGRNTCGSAVLYLIL